MDLVLYYNKSIHTARLLTGFHELAKKRKYRIEYRENIDNVCKTPHSSIVEAHVNDLTIAFDMSDAFDLNNKGGTDYLSKVDMYFCRSFSKDYVPSDYTEKVKPFGFDYYTTYPGNPADKIINHNPLHLIKRCLYTYPCTNITAFEKKPDYKDHGLKILFMTRLWDPNEISLDGDLSPEVRSYREYMIEERNKINPMRIEIIRQLQGKYGNAFVGGVQKSPFSVKECPDIIIPDKYTRKKAYLHTMHNSDICIGSMGLHKSIGWKTGEYIAASRAIVAERFCYDVPGDFNEKNYLPFGTVEECLATVEKLYKSPDLVYKMKQANEEYYWKYLRPEVQILNALTQVPDVSRNL